MRIDAVESELGRIHFVESQDGFCFDVITTLVVEKMTAIDNPHLTWNLTQNLLWYKREQVIPMLDPKFTKMVFKPMVEFLLCPLVSVVQSTGPGISTIQVSFLDNLGPALCWRWFHMICHLHVLCLQRRYTLTEKKDE